MRRRPARRIAATTAVVALAAAGISTAAATTSSAATTDSFYSYSGSAPLSSYAPGTVLKSRTLQYHVVGIPTPVTAIQLLFRTTDAQGRPSAGVTSVIRSITGDTGKAVSYQSFYDSLNPADSPSRAIAGDLTLGGVIPNAEALFLAPLVLQGYNVVIPDTEGQSADFAAGPEYGTTTLDSIRAATSSAAGAGMNSDTKFGLEGYSGGAIATGWAAALAPSYAPDVNRDLVGFADGGLLVDPAHNLKYVNGSLVWSGVIPMAIIGVARSYGIDFSKYLTPYGMQVYNQLQQGSIVNALGEYPGLTWQKMAKPAYADPDSVPEFVNAVNKINLGSVGTPTIPGYIAQGDGGVLEGTFSNPPGIGTGDGVMVAGDVRALARQYCATGDGSVKFDQFDPLSHVGTAVAWAPLALGWLNDRFAGKAAPSDCGSIAAGNSLAPEQVVPAS
ncbi:triacylglycerol lipase [Catenulispora sp. NL8]|uniref:Triacylglycerol lipase n=1 Tax=Catenulispora pinistramenti TaxID=2705254 RepID=A0ABS5L3L6_9ACTN|nr:lipase family protein [Catenulispora pinistramenti]MBS2552705.1 triacylglycerol lipase [Catenulispora pinistramenti]